MKPTMPTDQFKPGDFPPIAELKAGDKLVADDGFPCLDDHAPMTSAAPETRERA